VLSRAAFLDGATAVDIQTIKQAMEKRPAPRAAILNSRSAISSPNAAANRVTQIVNRPLKASETIQKLSGGEGGIRTHVPELPDHPISSRRRYDHFGTSPINLKFCSFT
jgi:hypothetical protein